MTVKKRIDKIVVITLFSIFLLIIIRTLYLEYDLKGNIAWVILSSIRGKGTAASILQIAGSTFDVTRENLFK